MKARDIMTREVITASENDTIQSIVDSMLRYRISAVPVVDGDGRPLGIVSEGDLLHRPEVGAEKKRSWWLWFLADEEELRTDFSKAHGRRAADVMTRSLVTADEDESVASIAEKLERHRIKRVPVLRDGRVVGIVSRANVLQCFGKLARPHDETADTAGLRDRIFQRLGEAGVRGNWVNVIVLSDTVELWGAVDSAEQLRVAELAVEAAAPGYKLVNNLGVLDRRSLGGYGGF